MSSSRYFSGSARESITRRMTKLECTPLVAVHIRHHHLEHVVRLLAGNQVALLHFRVLRHLILEVLEALGRVAVHGDLQDHGQRQAQLLPVQHHGMVLEQPRVLELLDPARAGRGGQAHALGKLEIGQAPVFLQRGEDLEVETIEFVRRLAFQSNKIPFSA